MKLLKVGDVVVGQRLFFPGRFSFGEIIEIKPGRVGRVSVVVRLDNGVLVCYNNNTFTATLPDNAPVVKRRVVDRVSVISEGVGLVNNRLGSARLLRMRNSVQGVVNRGDTPRLSRWVREDRAYEIPGPSVPSVIRGDIVDMFELVERPTYGVWSKQ